jgi:outer membrane protein
MKLIKIFFLFVSISSFAQSKVGTVDIDFILSQMPELTSVQAQVEDYGKELDVDFKKNMDAYNVLIKAYTDNESTFTDAVKKEKQDAIIATENDLGKFQQNGSKLLNIRRDELLRPLYQKIGVALDKVAKAGGYTQVLQIDEYIVYLDNTLDITMSILKELGIEVKTEE